MTRAPLLIATVAWACLAAACSGGTALDARSETPDDQVGAPSESFDQAVGGLRVNVFPAVTPDEAGNFPLLPQTFEFPAVKGLEVDLGPLRLDAADLLNGSVIGFKHNPLISTVPGREVAVGGSVFVERSGTVENYRGSTDPKSGAYALRVLRPATYDVTVIPDDPLLPMHTAQVELNTDPAVLPQGVEEGDLDIGLGVPVYGQVTAQGVPVENARVYVVDDAGHESVTVRTDELGRYLVRVAPDAAYTVVCEGARTLHPVWSRRRFAQPSRGALVDFPYPNSLDPQGVATGEVVSEVADQSVDGTRIRFVSTSLDGFDGLLDPDDEVQWSWEEVVDGRGIVTVRVAPGTYRVELIPPSAERSVDRPDPGLVFSPYAEDGVTLPAALGERGLPPTDIVAGTVWDLDGAPVVDATIRCDEVGFGSRSSMATTDELGYYEMELSRVPLTCEVVPPQNERGRAQLAIRTFELARPGDMPSDIFLDPGILFQAQVLDPELAPQPFAWVEVRDLVSDDLLTYGIANKGGEVYLRGETDRLTAP